VSSAEIDTRESSRGVIKMKTAAAVCLVASLALGSPAFAAERAAKHPSPVQCEGSVDDVLHILAVGAKGISVSSALTPKQYSFMRGKVKTNSKGHKDAPGDGAVVVDRDGEFALLFTKGTGDDTKVCGHMVVPGELVAAIVAVEIPEGAAPDAKAAPKADPDRPWL
jgi:hypothetical protein